MDRVYAELGTSRGRASTQMHCGSAPIKRFPELGAAALLRCRWPGCDQLALVSDIDHTVPYPYGPTQPSTNKPYCRIQSGRRVSQTGTVTSF